MARRSSARLRNRNSSTPKRVSLSHDASALTPRTAPSKLQALREYDEMPGAFPGSVSPPTVDVNKIATRVPLNFNDSTPKQSTPVKPASEEMSPKHHQQSTAKPMEEARWLGFSNMAPHTEPMKRASKIAQLQSTPTKATQSGSEPGSPRFRFTFGREQSLELSPEAKKLMSEKREEALRIREQMVANGEGPQDSTDMKARKFATPKGKKSRFSGVHFEQFKKMDSIAGHASAFRADPSKLKPTATPIKSQDDVRAPGSAAANPPKSLKRSPSKAGLTESDRSKPPKRPNENLLSPAQSHVDAALAISSRVPPSQHSADTPHVQRLKRADSHDVTTAPPAADVNKSLPRTPDYVKKHKEAWNICTIASPTQASLARSASIKSVKSSKIPGPAFPVSTPKAVRQEQSADVAKLSTPLLARSPSKAPLFSKPDVEKPKNMLSPLLMRTPAKISPLKKVAEGEENGEVNSGKAPLLSRSPFKMSRNLFVDPKAEEPVSHSRDLLLARTPVKLAMSEEAANAPTEQKPGSAIGGTLMGRFNLLRSSPMKSILRSPQRLYSNDPAKVAAGTHLASPVTAAGGRNKALPLPPSCATPVEKHVDFTSSTKARYECAQSELESTPQTDPSPRSKEGSQGKPCTAVEFAKYPTLPTEKAESSPTPQKRRQTAAPGDFTFTSHGREIIFGQSPNAPATVAGKGLPSTIRHVSAEPQFPSSHAAVGGSRKRKFNPEKDEAANEDEVKDTSDKENADKMDAERPAKRMRPTAPEPVAAKGPTRLPTLGVKPKKTMKDGKEKKPSVISRARLNALAQPKRKA